MAEQEHYETRRYRRQYQDGRVKRLMFESPETWIREPATLGQTVIDLLDAKAAFEAQARADTYISAEARAEIAQALREETQNALDVVDKRRQEAFSKRLQALTPDAGPQTDNDRLARQIELQRAEARLTRLADARVSPMDVISQSDTPMLDALEANPRTWLGDNIPHGMAEIISARRRELATPAERVNFDKREALIVLGKRLDALMAHARYEADGGDSTVRPAAIWR